MGWADYLSRAPSGAAPPVSHYDKSFSVAVCRHIKETLQNCSRVCKTSENISSNHVRRPCPLVRTSSTPVFKHTNVSLVARSHTCLHSLDSIAVPKCQIKMHHTISFLILRQMLLLQTRPAAPSGPAPRPVIITRCLRAPFNQPRWAYKHPSSWRTVICSQWQ